MVVALAVSGCHREQADSQLPVFHTINTEPPATEMAWLPQTCQGLVAQNLTEDTDGTVVLTLYNPGPRGLCFGMMAVRFEDHTLYFQTSWLPAGETARIREFLGASLPSGSATISCLQSRWDWFSTGEGKIALYYANGCLTVENISGEWLPGMTLYCRGKEDSRAEALCLPALHAQERRSVYLEPNRAVVAVVFDGQ